MNYKTNDIDTDKFLDHLNWLEKYDNQKQKEEKIAITKYHEGYIECLNQVKNMFFCSNYEKDKVDKKM